MKERLLKLYGLLMYFRWRFSGYDHIGKLIELMPKGWREMKILDAGSGPGVVASDKRVSGVDITCVDASGNAVKACKKLGLKAFKMDVRDIARRFSPGDFDIVWCLDIIEHLKKKDALEFIDKLEKIGSWQVVVFIPLGYLPQDRDPSGSTDLKLVRHRSFWKKEEFIERGYHCQVMHGYHWDIRLYCSSLEDVSYPIVRDAMWAVKTF